MTNLKELNREELEELLLNPYLKEWFDEWGEGMLTPRKMNPVLKELEKLNGVKL